MISSSVQSGNVSSRSPILTGATVAITSRRMNALPEVGVGIVGYGLMGRAHAYGWRTAPHVRDLPCVPRLRVMSGRDEDALRRAASLYGVEEVTTDWRALVERPDVQIVDVCTPPGTHAEIVEAAAAAGKAVLCEKPLAADLASADGRRRRRRARRGAQRDRLQLPAAPGALADEGDDRRGPRRPDPALARDLALGRVPRPGDPVRLALRATDGRDDDRRPRLAPDRPRALDGRRDRRGRGAVGDLHEGARGRHGRRRRGVVGARAVRPAARAARSRWRAPARGGPATSGSR